MLVHHSEMVLGCEIIESNPTPLEQVQASLRWFRVSTSKLSGLAQRSVLPQLGQLLTVRQSANRYIRTRWCGGWEKVMGGKWGGGVLGWKGGTGEDQA